MHTKTLLTALAVLAIAAPVSAQGGMANMDPTTVVKGTGILPSGWKLRFDPPRRGPVPEMTAIRFETMGSGFHIVSGPAAIYYKEGDVGTFVTATFAQQKTMAHEVFGVFIGGSNLQDSTQNYLYFVVRPSDGMAMVSHRSSNGKPTAILPYFAAPSINKDDPKDGHATNTLAIHVAQDSVHFVINGKTAAALAKTALDGAATTGQVGIRVNHNMDLMITNYKVSK
jgi:hypothetical protein